MNYCRSQILNFLEQAADSEYRSFMQKLLPGVSNLIGVRIPELRRFAKKEAKENPKLILDSLNYVEYFEEILLYGMVIGYADLSLKERADYLNNFIPYIDNWSVCDSTISTCKFMKNDREFWFRFIKDQIMNGSEYHIRFGVVCIKNYFIKDEFIDRSIHILKNIQTNQYYAQMSIAWTICEIYFHYENRVLNLFNGKELDQTILKMTIQKIKESQRGNSESKKRLDNYLEYREDII